MISGSITPHPHFRYSGFSGEQKEERKVICMYDIYSILPLYYNVHKYYIYDSLCIRIPTYYLFLITYSLKNLKRFINVLVRGRFLG